MLFGGISLNSINFLLNVLFIIIPLYVYQILLVDLKKVNPSYRNHLITFLLSVSIFLCLSFPVTVSEGIIFDLRQIPLIIGSLYGGYIIAIPLYLIANFYRFIINGDGVWISLAATTIIVIFVPLIRSKFLLSKTKLKILFSMTTSITSSLIIVVIATLVIGMSSSIVIIALNYIFIQSITIALLTYLIEKMRESMTHIHKIQENERLQIASQLAASVSHEVRNPLTVTKGFLTLLQENNITNEKRIDYLKLALSELNRAEAIINDYLSLARPKQKLETVGNITKDVINSTNILTAYALMNQVELITEIEEACKELTAKYDPQQFQQCLLNIGKNAIEAMPNGGVLKFGIHCGHENNIIININDTGVGMTPEEISKLYTPYYSTKETGTGLGMIVVSEMIQAMQGRLEINSKKGEGTTFSISIPLHIK